LILLLVTGGLCFVFYDIPFELGSLAFYVFVFAILGLGYLAGFQQGWESSELKHHPEDYFSDALIFLCYAIPSLIMGALAYWVCRETLEISQGWSIGVAVMAGLGVLGIMNEAFDS
jgi:hypothetical protein